MLPVFSLGASRILMQAGSALIPNFIEMYPVPRSTAMNYGGLKYVYIHKLRTIFKSSELIFEREKSASHKRVYKSTMWVPGFPSK